MVGVVGILEDIVLPQSKVVSTMATLVKNGGATRLCDSVWGWLQRTLFPKTLLLPLLPPMKKKTTTATAAVGGGRPSTAEDSNDRNSNGASGSGGK